MKQRTPEGISRSAPLLHIYYEDNHLLVCEKEAGILCQADGSQAIDLLSLVREYIRISRSKPGQVYVGLVHRLDRNVSGAMVFALTSKAAARLSEQFRNRTPSKEYVALVHGSPLPPSGILDDYLVKDEERRMAQAARPGQADARQARLRYRTLRRFKDSQGRFQSLLLVTLETGRFHQIRFQLGSRGWPILGDRKYGLAPTTPAAAALLLHCRRLRFEHPVQRRPLHFISRLPAHWRPLTAH
ncbi:MAG: RluA family pseudouridine synthase [Leptospirales bacterium]|nr:RluA family pseudouridine synthase [Leptospirales bacterium]